jgi:hypothetical protein
MVEKASNIQNRETPVKAKNKTLAKSSTDDELEKESGQ